MRSLASILLITAVLLAVCPADPIWAEELRNLQMTPEILEVSTFFTGGRITVTGEIPAADDLLLSISGPAVNSRYDLIGRYGPFWMTRGQVELENAPNMYILLLPDGDSWTKRLPALHLGLEQLQDRVTMTETDASEKDIFPMFVKLKESEELYGEIPGAVTYGPTVDGYKPFTVRCDLPSSTSPGTYDLQASVIDQAGIVEKQSRPLAVREVGFIQFVHHLAMERRLAYGVMAVVIALLTGALMGLLFKGGGGH